MKEIRLSKNVSIPLDVLSLRWVEFGNSGAGKTALGRVIFEEADTAGVPTCVIDLKGDWWGLKSSKSGESDGRDVIIFGGDHADVPLNENAGVETANIVVELRKNFILDFEAFSRAKQLKFIAAFMERFYDANREPFNLICDETDRYIPQKIRAGDNLAPFCVGACEDVAKRGRKHGIFPKFITQRNADINKSVTELCDLAVIFRTSGPNDQKAVLEWLRAKGNLITEEQIQTVIDNMAGLVDGEGFICSAHPKLRIFERANFRWPETFNSSATPEIGKTIVQPKKFTKVDLAALGERIKSTIEEAKKNDPAHLKAEVARLKKELDNRPLESDMPAPEPIPAFTAEDRKLVERAEKLVLTVTEKMENEARKILDGIADFRKFLGEIKTRLDKVNPPPRPVRTPLTRVPITREFLQQQPPPKQWHAKVNHTPQSNGSLPEGETKILAACIQFDSGVTKQQLTVLTGFKRSTRDAYIARLRTKGYVQEMGDKVTATTEGCAALPNAQPLPTGEELQKYWLDRLPEGERKIFEILLNNYPSPVDKETLTEQTGFKRSTRDAYLSRMSSKMITAEPHRGMVMAAQQLFE